MTRNRRAELPAGVPPVPPEAERYSEIRSRVHYTVYDHADCRWRFNPRGLVTFIRYNKAGGLSQIISGPAYKEPTRREGIHVVGINSGSCVKCGCSREARLDNLPETKVCRGSAT